MTVVVIGGDGQLGQAMGRAIPGAVRLSRSDCDVTDPRQVLDVLGRLHPTHVVLAAAYAAVDRAEDDFITALRVNTDGARHVAAACEALDAVLVYPSTDYVFDGRRAPYRSGDAIGPVNAYGWSKAAGELAVRRWPRHVILRTSWLFGPDRSNFVQAIVHRAKAGRPLRVVADQRGHPTGVDQLARAIGRMIADPAPFGTWHAVAQPAATWAELAVEVVRCLGMEASIEPIATEAWPTRAVRPRDTRLASGAFERRFGGVGSWLEELPAVVEAWR